LLGAAGAWLTGQPPGTAGLIFYGGILSLVLAWAIGGLQAAASGLAVVFFAARMQRYSLPVAAAAGGATGLAYFFIHLADEGAGAGFVALTLAVHAVAALVCALLARVLFPLAGQASSAAVRRNNF